MTRLPIIQRDDVIDPHPQWLAAVRELELEMFGQDNPPESLLRGVVEGYRQIPDTPAETDAGVAVQLQVVMDGWTSFGPVDCEITRLRRRHTLVVGRRPAEARPNHDPVQLAAGLLLVLVILNLLALI